MAETSALSAEDRALVDGIRARDEEAFEQLVRREYPTMLRLARRFVPSEAVAGEVVQETWLGVLGGIDRFEGRSSLRTWIYRILTNIAKTRGARERRSTPFSSLAEGDEPAVDPERFVPAGEPGAGSWIAPPADWEGLPEARFEAKETLATIRSVLDSLPPMQAEVLRLRDVLGWSSADVRNALEISETNQRVLLHRARSKVRRALERSIDQEPG